MNVLLSTILMTLSTLAAQTAGEHNTQQKAYYSIEYSSSSFSGIIQSSETVKHIQKREICERETNYKEALLYIRLALQSYLMKNYRHPKDLEEIFPLYLECRPKIDIGKGYEYSVEYIRTSAYDKDYKQAVNGSSAYLYFSDPQSIYFGLVLINSLEKSPEGTFYYLY